MKKLFMFYLFIILSLGLFAQQLNTDGELGSAVDLRRRVRSYFTAAEKRSRIANMLDTTVQVRAIPTPTEIEARVRELRLIAELDPPVNRRSRSPRSQNV